ncbi:Mini-ribonuclease 3 [Candidatus Merdisoma sp. HCP28S3_D10]|uniref:Mini-ribonuclease 3 n=1 Tax=unclassified Candidatus Merdisoma TaxID=3099611 RepID=UPI003F8CABA5
MEKSIMDLMSALKENWELPDVDVRTYSPLVLAYIGDAVYELVIRSLLVGRGNAQANRLHKEASTLVNAGAQSASLERIKEELTEEEMQVFKRGRNANSATMAKHATMSDYRRATGFEALMGYLYLTGRMERILELVKKGLE